ncbi:MAG: right-handed parallel beta-helix repeat-containing protein, partial [Candidatus Cloacimonetes bacterium]|nr:right-handed parallel beta-helix repeat-containing protein [Candidatus Cloacimonadota bacterium]
NWYDCTIPYIITENPTIEVGDLLEISAGVDVQFENCKKMDIYGTLNANGVNGNKVFFTRNDSTDTWNGLHFQYGAAGNLDYCYIQYATCNDGYAISADSTDLSINDCLIRYNTYGLYGENQQTILANSTFQNNTYGYYVQNTADPNTNFGAGNEFSDNTGAGIYYKDCSSLGTIENLMLQNNEGAGALRIANSGAFIIGTNTISGNNWPLSIDAGSFPDLTSIIPTTGNSNNDIQVVSGTGTKTGTWHNFTDLNYIVAGTPTVGAAGSLTIAEGDSLKFNSGQKFNIYGIFNAVGDEIIFTRNGLVDWQGLWCYNGSTANIDSCTIEYATYYSSYGIYVNQSSPAISNCTIRQCDYGIYADNGTPILSNNSIMNNGTGIYFVNIVSPDISTANLISDNSSVGIHYYNCSGTPNISNQTILNNTGTYGAIYMQNCGTFSLGTNTFTGNTFPLTINILSYPDDPSLNNIPISGNINDDVQVYGGSTGTNNFTWKELNDPLDYVVKSSITISNGGSLTIQDNIDVLFENTTYINVYGTLNCQGTGTRESDLIRSEARIEDDSKLFSTPDAGRIETKSELSSNHNPDSRGSNPELSSNHTSLRFKSSYRSPGILFTCWQETGAWNGVKFYANSSGDLDYCTIEYATMGTSYGIYTDSPTSLTVDNCVLQYNDYGFWGDNVPAAVLTSFTNNDFIDNGTGVYILDTDSRNIDNSNTIMGNSSGIYFYNCISPTCAAIIQGNTSYGVVFDICSTPAINSNVTSNSSGIYFNNCTSLGTIDNISVTNNTGDYGAFKISNCGDFTLGSGIVNSGNSWPLSIDCGSFPDISSTIPTTGNTNNDIQVVSGTGNKTGTWHIFTDLDYIVNSSPDLDGILTIAAGNTLKFGHHVHFRIDGTLHAPGTAVDNIHFTRDEVYEWKGLQFQNGSTGDLDYCTIEYATADYAYGVYAYDAANISLNNCILQNNDYGFYGHDINPDFSTNNKLINNLQYGIFLDGDCTPAFGSSLTEWNNIYGNGTYDFRNGDNDISVEYVYWGTEVYSEIEDQIYDRNDSGSLGLVDYVPYTNAVHDTEFQGAIDPPQNLTISADADSVYLSWDAVEGASSYNIYASLEPYPADWGTPVDSVSATSWSRSITEVKEFYQVTASTEPVSDMSCSPKPQVTSEAVKSSDK